MSHAGVKLFSYVNTLSVFFLFQIVYMTASHLLSISDNL